MKKPEECIKELFEQHFNTRVQAMEALMETGSYRQYYRIKSDTKDVLGVYNTDVQENKAYLSFTQTFRNENIQVPEVFVVSEDKQTYLIEDLGPNSLYDIAQEKREADGNLSTDSLSKYKLTLSELLRIQTQTVEKIDLTYCYPRNTFDKQSILWDLNYFKYFFLKLLRVNTDEQMLENDIQRLSDNANKVKQDYFLYRDFQSRNVMIKNNKPYFIDFQGGRRGSFYYDVASLLYDANVELSRHDRETLLDYYYSELNTKIPTDKEAFQTTYNLFAVVRLTQALGAFGLRGVVEHKPNFKECIPFALSSLKGIISETDFAHTYPTISQAKKKKKK